MRGTADRTAGFTTSHPAAARSARLDRLPREQ